MSPLRAVVCLSLLALAGATQTKPCPDFAPKTTFEVELVPCKSLPCKLKKGTTQHITIKFTPDEDMREVTNIVGAKVFNVPVPFPGVDGTSIKDKVFTETGEKAKWPLIAGKKYIYKDSFPILSIYPSFQVEVYWKLRANNKNEIVCFLVPAKIIG